MTRLPSGSVLSSFGRDATKPRASPMVSELTCPVQPPQALDNAEHWSNLGPQDRRRNIDARFHDLHGDHDLASSRKDVSLQPILLSRTINRPITRMGQDQ